jgi:benzoate-CoA ligase
LINDDGHECADGELGELQINGPSAAIMYWNNREKTKHTFAGEWTRSGDKYSRDAHGYYTYGGRSDDMLKVGGIYVSPFEVEASLMTHPAVLEAAVVGQPDEEGLVKPKAYVVLKPGQQVAESELKAHVKSQLAPYKYPRVIELVFDKLFRDIAGKQRGIRSGFYSISDVRRARDPHHFAEFRIHHRLNQKLFLAALGCAHRYP